MAIRTNQELLTILYNLIGNNSCIKGELVAEKDTLIEDKNRSTEELTKESESLNELNLNQKAVEVGPDETRMWIEEFEKNADLQRFFGLMEVEFDNSTMREKLLNISDVESLKNHICDDILKTTEKIESLRKHIEDNGIKAEELEEQIADYERASHELGRIISDVLGGAETYTRNYIGDILRKISSFSKTYALSESEIAVASKLILFPEEELKQFNDQVLQGKINTDQVTEAIEEEEVKEEPEPVIEPASPLVEESKNVGIFADQIPSVKEDTTQPTELTPKAEIISENVQEENPFVTFEEAKKIAEEDEETKEDVVENVAEEKNEESAISIRIATA